jgi:homoserine kinase type II
MATFIAFSNAVVDLGESLASKGTAEGVFNSNFLVETNYGRFILKAYEAHAKEKGMPFFLGSPLAAV